MSRAVDMLRAAIAKSGLSARQFAEQVLIRDERTIRRWISGESPIPDVVIGWLNKNAA
jgi:hypothetical protein